MSHSAATIHVIDDDPSLRTALARLLTVSGYRVAQYESAHAFLARPVEEAPGCILLDVNMPGLNGLELQERLSAMTNFLPIIFMTGYGDISMSVRAMKAGAEDFLAKPVTKEALLAAIENALVRHRELRKEHLHELQIEKQRERLLLLTPREREVFNLVLEGLLNKQIAQQLGNTERTVKAHRHNIMEKMQVKSVAELVATAARLGLTNRSSS